MTPMAQHLCIVARDNPLLLGYLSIALDYLTRGGDELEIVIDRRPEDLSVNGHDTRAAGVEQRRLQGVDELLRSRGYAIVTREPGNDWRLVNEAANVGAPMDGGEESSRSTMRLPSLSFPHLSLPHLSLPHLSLPRISLPRVSLPRLSMPRLSMPRISVPRVSVPRVSLPRVSMPRVSVPRLSPTWRRATLAAAGLAVIVAGVAAALPRDFFDRTAGAVAWLRGPADTDVVPVPRETAAPRETPAPAPRETPPSPPAVAVAPPAAIAPPVNGEGPAPERSRPLASARTTSDGANGVKSPDAAAPPREAAAPAKQAAPAPSAPRVAREPARPARESASRAEGSRTSAARTRAAREEAKAARDDAKAAREDAPSPPKAAVATVAVQKAPEPRGIPRMELSRERDHSGRTVAVTVRLTDTSGRPLPAADVRIRRQLGNGDIRETRLEAASEGSYRGPLPATVPNANGLTMRVTVGDSSHDVPLAE
jgi:hypothetical protein